VIIGLSNIQDSADKKV